MPSGAHWIINWIILSRQNSYYTLKWDREGTEVGKDTKKRTIHIVMK